MFILDNLGDTWNEDKQFVNLGVSLIAKHENCGGKKLVVFIELICLFFVLMELRCGGVLLQLFMLATIFHGKFRPKLDTTHFVCQTSYGWFGWCFWIVFKLRLRSVKEEVKWILFLLEFFSWDLKKLIKWSQWILFYRSRWRFQIYIFYLILIFGFKVTVF